MIRSLIGRIQGKGLINLKMNLIRGDVGAISHNYLLTLAFQRDLHRKGKMEALRFIHHQVQLIGDCPVHVKPGKDQ